MSEFVILNSHQWRKCHKETCCCAGNYVVLRGRSFVREFDTEEEAENYIESLTTAHSGLEKIEPLSMVYTGYTENGISYCTGSRPADNRELMNKLNEVIEKVNLIMEGMKK